MSASISQILALAENGRAPEAAARLEQLGRDGDASALFALGLWQLEGRHIARDLDRARQLIAEAARLELLPAERAWSALLATGVGGAPDWAGAMAFLEERASGDPLAKRQRDLIAAMNLTNTGAPQKWPDTEMLSDSPDIRRVPELFSADECRFLIELSRSRFRPATIFHEGQGRFVRHPVRDSDAAGFPVVFEWPFIHALNRRIAAASGTHVPQGETLQVLRYGPGQQYRPHFDAVPGLANQRHLTMLVYLNDDYDGGETSFPEAGLAVKGQTGDGLLFRNALPDGRPDPASRHTGLLVSSGEKLVASRWIRMRPAAQGESFGPHEVTPDTLSPELDPGH